VTAAGEQPGTPWVGIGLLFGAANGLVYGVAVALVARVPAERRGPAGGLVVGAYAAGPVGLGLVAPRIGSGAHAFPVAYGRVFTAWGCAGLVAPLLGGRVADGGPPVGLLLLAVPLALAAGALSVLARS
jgi:MFS transporter, OFA family, oxalate/formate antiporter